MLFWSLIMTVDLHIDIFYLYVYREEGCTNKSPAMLWCWCLGTRKDIRPVEIPAQQFTKVNELLQKNWLVKQ